MSAMKKPQYCRVSDSQEVFGIHRATIYRAAAKGLITIYKRQGMAFLKVSEVAGWIEGKEIASE